MIIILNYRNTTMKHTIDLLDTAFLSTLSDGVSARLEQLNNINLDGTSVKDKAYIAVRKSEQYVALAKLNVQHEVAMLKNWSWTPLETKLAKAKIAAAKVEVELAEENLGTVNAEWREVRRVIVID
tara:strand:- start:360 stop:737 length:378 start_codon:yes stop_codon:yes gene_type:complete